MQKLLHLTLLLLLFSCKKSPDNGGPSTAPTPVPIPTPTPPLTSTPVVNNNIVFYRKGTSGGIYTSDESGSNEKKLLEVTGSKTVAYPNWSKEGRIYFTGTLQEEANAQLYSIKEDGTDVMRITNNAAVQYSRLNVATNNQLLYIKTFTGNSSEPGLFTNKLDGTAEKKIMDLAGITLSDVSWYPGGSQIIYVSDETKNTNGEKVSNIFLMNADGTGKMQLTRNTKKEAAYDHPYICPDGSRFVYTYSPDVNTSGYSAYVADISGRNEYLLQPASSKTESWVSRNWTKEVTWILLADYNSNLFMVTIDGGNKKKVATAGSLDARLKDFY